MKETFAGATVPTIGYIIIGKSEGTENSKLVGPTGAISPVAPTRGTGCLNSFMLVCMFFTHKVAIDVSYKLVAGNWIT